MSINLGLCFHTKKYWPKPRLKRPLDLFLPEGSVEHINEKASNKENCSNNALICYFIEVVCPGKFEPIGSLGDPPIVCRRSNRKVVIMKIAAQQIIVFPWKKGHPNENQRVMCRLV